MQRTDKEGVQKLVDIARKMDITPAHLMLMSKPREPSPHNTSGAGQTSPDTWREFFWQWALFIFCRLPALLLFCLVNAAHRVLPNPVWRGCVWVYRGIPKLVRYIHDAILE
jgi:hypothetical protein